MNKETESVIDPEQIATVADLSARAGAAELMRLFGKTSVREKGPRDLVTEADIASQNAIQNSIASHFPDHLFVGEEEAIATGGDHEPLSIGQISSSQENRVCWVVDPLDGTTNYAHGMHSFAVSIAVIQSGKVLAGVIYDPTSDEMFSATKGRGAFCNGEPMSTSDCDDLNQALVAASFPANVIPGSPELQRFVLMLERCQAVRRLGSAALNLCYVAAGRLDGYWATSVKTWDVAAGYLIAKESGAKITQIGGEDFDIWNPRFVAAGSEQLHKQMIPVLSIDES